MGVEGIILAAGFSSRAGGYKMTMEYNNKTIIENVIDGMLSCCRRIIVVGGYRMENLQPVIKKYGEIMLVYNENYDSGMYSSVLKGINFVNEEKFFLTPGDYPLIEAGVYSEMLKFDDEIVIPTYKGKKGHPVLMKSNLIEELNKKEKYQSLRDFIRDKSPIFVPVSCRGILTDVDTAEDYKKLLC